MNDMNGNQVVVGDRVRYEYPLPSDAWFEGEITNIASNGDIEVNVVSNNTNVLCSIVPPKGVGNGHVLQGIVLEKPLNVAQVRKI